MNDVQNQYRDLNFKGQQANEKVVCFFRRHWITMVPHFLLFIGFLLFNVILLVNVGNIYDVASPGLFRILFLLNLVLSLFYIHYFFLKLFEHFLSVSIITNCRLVNLRKTVFIVNDMETCDLKMIQEINKHQNGILQNFLKFGDLNITLSQSSATICLKNIPNPEFHFRLLTRTQQAYINDRLLMKVELQEQARQHGQLGTISPKIQSEVRSALEPNS